MKRSTLSERALVLAPRGRDAAIAAGILGEAGLSAAACPSLPSLIAELNAGAAFVVATEEALASSDLGPLSAWLRDQEEWSDLPFVLLTMGGGGLERNPAARRYLDVLGNVTFLERPFHPTTLVSLARSALRARRRQYEARARLEALRESEARYRLLFDSIESGFCVVEVDVGEPGNQTDYRVVEANPAFYRQTGFSQDILGRWLREAAPTLEGHWYETYGRIARTGEPERFEQGSAALGRWFDVFAFRTGAPDERRVAILFNDISARRNAEERLRQLNETLETQVVERTSELQLARDIIEANASPICAFDTDYRLIAFNKAHNDEFRRVNGFDSTIGDVFPDLFIPEQRPVMRALMDRALSGERFTVVEEFGRPELGRPYWEIHYTPLRDEAGRVVGAFHLANDISARLRAQAELSQAQEALRQSQKLEAVGQLTGGVAHDFNNLLTIIKSSTDLLRRPDLPDERRRRYVDAISDTVGRAAKLTGQLLAFARRQALKPEVFDVAERVRTITEMLTTVVGSRIAIRSEVGHEASYVEADVSQFETALVNMAVNARDAMDGEGTLTIRVRGLAELPPLRGHAGGSGPFVAVSVGDTGVGIPEDKLGQIFEPFYTTKEVGKGTGLGLSQVYGFVKQSGGDVSVTSEPGQGTTFTLYMPRVNREPARLASRSPDASVARDGHGRRVLVVEDNVEVGRFSTQLLQDLGYETSWASNGHEALQLLAEADGFDAVFSDVVMPGMSGVDLGEEIRRRHPGLPVVLTSGYSHVLAEEGRHGFELLQKPYAAEELSRVLRRVTSRRCRPGAAAGE